MQSDMYASKWRYASIQNFVFIKNVSRHMFFNATKYQCCYILDNNYYDSRFIATNFTKCTIMDCLFLHSTIRGTVFSEGKMQHVRFDKSTLKRCRFSQCNMICDPFWNGCRILNCKYEQMQMTHNVIKGTNFVAVCFMDVKFWPTEFVGEFRKCQFINVKWGGSIHRLYFGKYGFCRSNRTCYLCVWQEDNLPIVELAKRTRPAKAAFVSGGLRALLWVWRYWRHFCR